MIVWHSNFYSSSIVSSFPIHASWNVKFQGTKKAALLGSNNFIRNILLMCKKKVKHLGIVFTYDSIKVKVKRTTLIVYVYCSFGKE